jgi:MFS family permease
MTGLWGLLRDNRNYRYAWIGQVVSETGDWFNNIAVFALAMEKAGSGGVVSGVNIARLIPVMIAGPIAGVALDRFDRKRIMIVSDLIRAAVAIAFLLTVNHPRPWLLYALSAALMFASPFFTSGRAAILPSIANDDEIHAANSVTQTTSWATLTAGTLLGGFSAAKFGYGWAFSINSLSFVISALCIWRIAAPGGLRAARAVAGKAVRPWHEYREGLSYMGSVPLIVGIGVITAGWALGGGAAQVLFTLFGETVFRRGASGIGAIWGFAGIGLLIGGAIGHFAGKHLSFTGFKRTVTLSYLAHGAAYIWFSQAATFPAALFAMMLSRVGMAITSVLTNAQLLRRTEDQYRGRVFATMETLRSTVMIASMAAAGIAWEYPRTVGLVAGALGMVTALLWAWRDFTGRLPEPAADEPRAGALDELRDRSA